MRILLTNDDGFDASGIKILVEELKKEHEVFVVAPLKNQSGTSTSINMFKNLEYKKINEYTYALDGTPTDCVIFAVKNENLSFKPDLLISGINKGANLGSDVIYSGTCGAARQGSFFGIPSIAISCDGTCGLLEPLELLNYNKAAVFLRKNISFLKNCISDLEFLNINVPDVKNIKGIKICDLSLRDYNDKLVLSYDEEKSFSKCIGDEKVKSCGDVNCDGLQVADGFISLSIIKSLPECNNQKLYEICENLTL